MIHLRLTTHRQTVLSIIQSSTDHPTARQIFERVIRVSPQISQATVYNTLSFLVNKGLIQRFNLGSDLDRYEATTERHDHVVCKSCGKIVDVNMNSAFKTFKIPVPAGFWIDNLTITVTGLCQKCKTKHKQAHLNQTSTPSLQA